MKVSERGLELIRRYEGFRAEAYRCPGGFRTIGYGHSTSQVYEGMKITLQQAEELLCADVLEIEKFLNLMNLKINQHQFDALVSFIYNVGQGNFRRSRLLSVIRECPSSPDIRTEFARWNQSSASGVLPGLVRRRQEEADLYFENN